MMSNDENNGLITANMIDEPLIIVLDEDDDDDLEEDFGPLITTIVTDTDDEDIAVQNLLAPIKTVKKKVFNRSNKSSNSSTNVNKSTRPILIDTSFTQPSNHQRRGKRYNPPPPADSVISLITFDKVSDVLTVSRMGSVYYCVEDLYLKLFSTLCTLDEFTDLLSQPAKQVTLSEKISITQQNSRLKKLTHLRYRLIPIESSDSLLKAKQLLITNKNKKRIENLRLYKQTTTSDHLHDKSKQKDLSLPPKKRSAPDYFEFNKRSKNDTEPNDTSSNGIDVPCDLYLTDKNTQSDHNLDKYSSFSIENIDPPRKIKLHRSKSLIFNVKEIPTCLFRSYSLPSIKFEIEDRIGLKSESNDSHDESYSMPMIVNVEENVHVDNPRPQQPSSSTSDPFPYLYDPSSSYLTATRTPYNLYFPDPLPTTIEKPRDTCPIIVSLLEKPVYHRLVTSEKPVPPDSTPSSSSQQPSASKITSSTERMIDQQNAAKSPLDSNQKPNRSSPYPKTKTYLAPLPGRQPPINKPPPKTMKSIRIQAPSIDLTQAIIEHNNCDMDKIPKLVIRHTKTYRNKAIDSMGQLFPSWFDEPNYRCIHCFNCDRVFTPQLFMTHLDDKEMANEKIVDMTPIQLLTSEKMSEYKVRLWNQFCTDLKAFASKFPEAMKKSSWEVFN